jgi:Protein of unknown function DUF262/Protein of unknown function (DUF1524)
MTDALSEAPAYGIARLVQEGRFEVPSHQRDYAWTEDDVKQLFDDVLDAIKTKTDSYFLGLLVFLFNGKSYTILDGQQRLATTIIIFAAIRDWLRQYNAHLGDATKIQDWYIGGSELGQHDPTPKLIMNQTNNHFFVEYVVKGAAIDDVAASLKKLKRGDPNKLLLEAILYSHGRVKEIAKTFSDSNKAAKYFFTLINYFRDNIRTVRLIAKDENAAYTLFETLNDRGVDLAPLDFVKNFLFKQAAGKSAETLRDMQARWVQMIATLANVKAAGFLKAYWTSRHGRIRANLLFDTFRTKYADADKAVELSIDLLAASEQYAALDSSQDAVWAPYSKETRVVVASLKLIGSQQAHPVILSALKRFSVSETQKLLRLLEVAIVRFLLVGGGNPGRFEPACARLAQSIYDGNIKTASAAFTELKDVYPPDPEFENAFKFKREGTNQKAQYFLRALEKEEQRLAKGKMAGEWEPGAVTVEHILPKKPGTDWSALTAADPEIVDDCATRLGNMCLLTKINEKLGNKGFSKKKPTFAKSELLTTKAVASYALWDRNAIDSRQADLAKLAKSIWRFT